MPYKHLLFLEIAWDVLPREIIIYSCYEEEKTTLILCHVIYLVVSRMQYAVEVWEGRKQTCYMTSGVEPLIWWTQELVFYSWLTPTPPLRSLPAPSTFTLCPSKRTDLPTGLWKLSCQLQKDKLPIACLPPAVAHACAHGADPISTWRTAPAKGGCLAVTVCFGQTPAELMEAVLQTSWSPEFSPLFVMGWTAYTVDLYVGTCSRSWWWDALWKHAQSSSSTWSAISSLWGTVTKYRLQLHTTRYGTISVNLKKLVLNPHNSVWVGNLRTSFHIC